MGDSIREWLILQANAPERAINSKHTRLHANKANSPLHLGVGYPPGHEGPQEDGVV
jgi:hypothetical protein